MMFREKEAKPSRKHHVRFETNSDPSSSKTTYDESKDRERRPQSGFTYYLSKLKSIFSTHRRQEANENEIDEPVEENKDAAREQRAESSMSLSDVSSAESTSRESLETDFSPEKMSGDEQSAYKVVRSALKYGYANHIINRNDHVFWLRKFPGFDSDIAVNTSKKKKDEDEGKSRKRKRPKRAKNARKKSPTEHRKTKRVESSTESSSESILSSPYKICKIKCVSKK